LNGKAGAPVGSPVTSTVTRAVVKADALPKELEEGDLQIEYIKPNGSKDWVEVKSSDEFIGADTFSNESVSSSKKSASAIAIAAAINNEVGTTGVHASANSAVISATKTTVSKTPIYTDLYVNGVKVSMSLSSSDTVSERRKFVIDSINAKTTEHGVIAGDSGNGGLTLKTIDGRNLSVWYDGDAVDGSDFGLGANTATASDPDGVTGLKSTTFGQPVDLSAKPVAASTVYGTVTLNSNSAFTVRPGSKSFGSSPVDSTFANFTALGFRPETVNPKNIGRLSFQVGPSPDQLIHIDFADFGKDGDITGAITSDKAPTNILTVQAANDVTQSVNKSLDMIAQTRASMGAVMNRLEHVIDNLTNVVMNSEASRSQIEDADYAKASTELARTQIMQQAATAVLAQANTSQQSVLKLLQA
jgi:flagellin